jgi:hypothetical protein
MEDYQDKKVLYTIIKYVGAFLLCSILTWLFLLVNNIFAKTELVDIYRTLADAFTFSGLLPILVCILIALTNEGSLDAIGWMLKRFAKTLIPLGNKSDETYEEYKSRRKKVTGFSFMIYVGLAFLITGIVFIVLFYQVYEPLG